MNDNCQATCQEGGKAFHELYTFWWLRLWNDPLQPQSFLKIYCAEESPGESGWKCWLPGPTCRDPDSLQLRRVRQLPYKASTLGLCDKATWGTQLDHKPPAGKNHTHSKSQTSAQGDGSLKVWALRQFSLLECNKGTSPEKRTDKEKQTPRDTALDRDWLGSTQHFTSSPFFIISLKS